MQAIARASPATIMPLARECKRQVLYFLMFPVVGRIQAVDLPRPMKPMTMSRTETIAITIRVMSGT